MLPQVEKHTPPDLLSYAQNCSQVCLLLHIQAINSFCRELSATRSDTLIGLDRLEHHIRGELDTAAPRALAVLHPLKVVLEGLTGEQQVTCRVSHLRQYSMQKQNKQLGTAQSGGLDYGRGAAGLQFAGCHCQLMQAGMLSRLRSNSTPAG